MEDVVTCGWFSFESVSEASSAVVSTSVSLESTSSSVLLAFAPSELRGAESSLPVAHPGYQVLPDILFRLGLIVSE